MGITYYVSAAEGNNNNPGNAPDKPFRTIQAAINKAQAGDTIYVRSGSYAERLYIQKAGTPETPILISAYQGEHPVIDGSNLNIREDEALIAVQQSQDVALVGLTVRQSGGRGIMIGKSSRVAVRACAVETCYAGGLHGTQCDTLLIEQCRIRDCGRRFLTYGPARTNVALLVKYSKDVTIQDNQVYENSDEGICVSVGCQKVMVRKNTCYDNRSGQINVVSSVDVSIDANLCYHTGRSEYLDLKEAHSTGITVHDLKRYQIRGSWHTREVRVTNNIIVGCDSGFSTGQWAGQFNDFHLAHNTILNSTSEAVRIGLLKPSVHSYIENNLIASSNGGEMASVSNGEGIVWRHNLWSSFPGEHVYNPVSDLVEAEAGLVNPDAPLTAGAVTPEAYKLVSASAAIGRGIYRNGESLPDFWGTPRDNKPDIGANEFPGGIGEAPAEGPTLPPAGTRVTEGLVTLYEFLEGQGQQIQDTSGFGEPLSLKIMDETRVAWTDNGLEIKEPVLITSERPASKVVEACRAANEITIEAWLQPANTTQNGPARIISNSSGKTQRNFSLGQGLHSNLPTDLYMVRLRTSKTSSNGLPAVVTPAGTATSSLTHIVYTRRADTVATLYVNGQDKGVLNIEGDFNNWDDKMPLLLANESSEDRPWQGLLRLTAIYSRALAPVEVVHNYETGFAAEQRVSAEFSILPGDEQGVIPHVVEFDSTESRATDGIASYFWEFGDGQTATQANPVYTYTAAGVYTVSLTITDTKGATDKVTKENLIIVVATPLPPLPAVYARFILIEAETSKILAFGTQYPNLRCTLMWNDEPSHLMVFSDVDDVYRTYTEDKVIELIWIDELEEL